MKPLIPLLLAALFTTPSLATDRVVNVAGTGATFPNIVTAVNASLDGDRVIVVPGTYYENLSITKSVEIVSMVPGKRYTITGDVVLFPPANSPKNIVIHDLRALGRVRVPFQINGTHSLAMFGCITGTIDIGNNGSWNVTLANDSVLGHTRIFSGSITGCFLRGDTVQPSGGFRILQAHAWLKPLLIAGNVLGDPIEVQYTSGNTIIEIIATTSTRFENNFVRLYRPSYGASAFFINGLYQPAPQPCLLINNTFERFDMAGSTTSLLTDGTSGPIVLRNNLLIGPFTPIEPGPGDQFGYNMYSTYVSQVNPDTGKPMPGCDCIDAGDPDNSCADLDLSRNDIGCYGGSFSRDQFDDPVPNTAIITWSELPRRTITATSMSVRAHGVDR